MKMNQVTDLIKNVVSKEIRKTIIRESKEGKIEKFAIKCEGVPMGYFDTEEEAQEAMSKMDKNKGELIIEKETFDSHEEMMNKLDEMNDQIDEEKDCQECGKSMEEDSEVGENAFVLAADAAKDEGKDEFEFPKGSGKMHKVTIKQDINNDDKQSDVNEGIPLFLPAVIKGLRDELGREPSDEEIGKEMKKMFTKYEDDIEDKKDKKKKKQKDVKEDDKTCNECGSMLNEEGMCNECGKSMYESKKKVLRLKESEMIKVIKKIIKESHPGLKAANASREASGKINKDHYADVSKNIGKFLELGEDEEFPVQSKKSELPEKVVNKVNMTPKENEVVNSNKRAMENLQYDHEPSEAFKKRLKMALEGDVLMGNSQEAANVVKTKTGQEKFKSIKKKEKEAKQEPLYKKERVPVDTKGNNVNENKNTLSGILSEEINKMKHISSYNKKTQ